jgi:hypothetical protein
MLKEFVPETLWTAQIPLRFYGIEMGTRMTICRLHNGDLWVHSPIRPDEALRQQIDALGTVRFIVAPNKLHHLFMLDFLACYPNARVFGSPDLPSKRPDIPFDGVLGDQSEPGWAADLDQVPIRGNIYLDEVVFFHRNSRTLILADLCESGHADQPLLTQIAMRVGGVYERPGPPIDIKLLFRDKQATRSSIEKVMDWDFDRMILSHGHLVQSDAKSLFRQAYSFAIE